MNVFSISAALLCAPISPLCVVCVARVNVLRHATTTFAVTQLANLCCVSS